MVPGLGAGKEAPIKIKYLTPVACAVTERSERRITWQGHAFFLRGFAAFVSQARQANKISLPPLSAGQVFYLLVLPVLVRERVAVL
jgi:hypothetical protein